MTYTRIDNAAKGFDHIWAEERETNDSHVLHIIQTGANFTYIKPKDGIKDETTTLHHSCTKIDDDDFWKPAKENDVVKIEDVFTIDFPLDYDLAISGYSPKDYDGYSEYKEESTRKPVFLCLTNDGYSISYEDSSYSYVKKSNSDAITEYESQALCVKGEELTPFNVVYGINNEGVFCCATTYETKENSTLHVDVSDAENQKFMPIDVFCRYILDNATSDWFDNEYKLKADSIKNLKIFEHYNGKNHTEFLIGYKYNNDNTAVSSVKLDENKINISKADVLQLLTPEESSISGFKIVNNIPFVFSNDGEGTWSIEKDADNNNKVAEGKERPFKIIYTDNTIALIDGKNYVIFEESEEGERSYYGFEATQATLETGKINDYRYEVYNSLSGNIKTDLVKLVDGKYYIYSNGSETPLFIQEGETGNNGEGNEEPV